MPLKPSKRARELRIELPVFSARAPIIPSSWDAKGRTFEAVIASERPVLRQYYQVNDGQPFDEVLGLEEGEFDLERFASGLAPLSDGHIFGRQFSSTAEQHGVAVEGSLRFETVDGFRSAVATFRMLEPTKGSPAFERTERLIAGIEQGVFRSGSIGYRVSRLKDVSEPNMPRKRYRAIAWEGDHYAMVPVHADTSSNVREASPTVPCIVEAMEEDEDPKGSTPEVEGARGAEGDANPNGDKKTKAQAKPAAKVDAETDADLEGSRSRTAVLEEDVEDPRMRRAAEEALDREEKRRDGILEAARAASLEDHPKVLAMLKKRTITVEGARSRMLSLVAERDEEQGEIGTRSPTVGRDRGYDSVIEGARDALLLRGDMYTGEHKVRGGKVVLETPFKPHARAREFENMSLLDICREVLRANGVRDVERMPKHELAELAIKHRAQPDYAGARAGALAAGDLGHLTADVAHKVLRQAYTTNKRTFLPLFRQTTTEDFKPITSVNLGQGASLEEIPEGGTYPMAATADDGITYRVKRYGKRVRLTQEAILNDDTSALDRMPMYHGNAAAREESDQAWALVTGNQLMGDGVALFHSSHANLTTGVISITSLNAALKLLSMQTDPDGQLMGNDPKYLAVPNDLYAIAQQFTGIINPTAAGSLNPFQGMLEVIVEPRLALDSALEWYVTSSPDQTAMGVIVRLRGTNGPTIQSKEGWEGDWLEYKVGHIFGVAIEEHRGFVRSSGA